MLKSIIFFIELILFAIFAIFASLMFGITLSNLSYENITISKLYLKYDKNLIVKVNNLIINQENSTSNHRFNADLELNRKDNINIININKLKYYTHDLTLKAKLELTNTDIDNILNKKIKNLELKDFSFKFDNFVKPVLTKKTFITYKNDNIYFNLEKPSVDNIKLPKSEVILKNITKNMSLYLALKSNDKISNKLLNIIAYYGLNLPIKQYYGKNSIDVKVEVPFYKEKIKVYVNVNVKKTKILYDNKLIHANELSIVFKNGILYIKSNKGDINIFDNNIKFNKLNLIYKDKLFDIKVFKGQINILDRNITFEDLNVDYNDKTKHIKLKSDKGKTKLKEYEIFYNNLKYDSLKNKKIININNGIVKLNKDVKFNKLNIELINNNFLSFNANVYSKDINVSINNKTNISHNRSEGTLFVKSISLNDTIKIKNKKFKYNLLHINDTLNLNIPNEKISYYYDGKEKHELNIFKYGSIFDGLYFMESNAKELSIKLLTKDNFENSKIYIDKFNVNINSDKFKKSQETQNKNDIKYPSLKILINNSNVSFDKRYLNIQTANVNFNKNNIDIDIKVKNEKEIISANIKNGNFEIKAKKLSSNFVNRLLKARKLKGGYVSLNAYGTVKYINGSVQLKKTKIKNMTLVNNLISFVNTTPYFINPILALPTLFRLGEGGFDIVNGYYVKKGNFDFSYNLKQHTLNIKPFYTKGLMADFKGEIKVDFKKKKINSILDIIFLKDISKLIKNIPIIGYIIVGEDGNFVTKINIDGSFNKQTFETHMVKDSTAGIVNAIKRTISLPLKPFDDEKFSLDDENIYEKNKPFYKE